MVGCQGIPPLVCCLGIYITEHAQKGDGIGHNYTEDGQHVWIPMYVHTHSFIYLRTYLNI